MGHSIRDGSAVPDHDAGTTVETYSVPDMLARLPRPGVALLKMDIEGGEYDVLLNTDARVFAHIDRIALEYHECSAKPSHGVLVKRLVSLGYKVTVGPDPHRRRALGMIYATRGTPSLLTTKDTRL